MLEQVLEKYPDQVKLIFLSFPLSNHRFSKKAAIAAFAAKKQGKFWEYHNRLFKNVDSLNEQKFLQIARELNLDIERFKKDMNDLKIVARINQDIRLGAYLGIRATPTVLINGTVSRARTLEALQDDVEKELARARKNSAVKGEKKG
ncbi:MAG: thioredoxin domain-containing protein [Deltaproteobacteria bacterium]|nr:thioredoxin domain-containing protein [Deltaproteobacteria bacterium]